MSKPGYRDHSIGISLAHGTIVCLDARCECTWPETILPPWSALKPDSAAFTVADLERALLAHREQYGQANGGEA
jgi:hypothetical protein